ncbi:hypothetical protein [Spirosoma pulveris]
MAFEIPSPFFTDDPSPTEISDAAMCWIYTNRAALCLPSVRRVFFRGSTFSDYESPIPDRTHAALGLEGLIGYQTALSSRLSLRLTGRLTPAVLFGPKDGEVHPYFAPRIGHVTGKSLAYSVGVGIHLLYQLHPRPTATSSYD